VFGFISYMSGVWLVILYPLIFQVHLPCQPHENMSGLSTWTNRQKIRGFVGLEWPADSWGRLVDRLETADSRGKMVGRWGSL
jgi:hypothetical protein